MMNKFSSRLSVLFGAILVLSACGGGGGGGGGTTEVVATEPPTVSPEITVGFGVGELSISWPTVSGATYYQLYKDPDGAGTSADFTLVADSITGTSVSDNVALYLNDWINNSYTVKACNSAGCSAASNEVNVADTTAAIANNSIGYIKSPLPELRGIFGWSIALSRDGSTMAVSAPWEDNVNGDQQTGTGAVYIYSRNAAGTWSQQARLKASNTGAYDNFGYTIALSDNGNTLAVGAFNEDGSGTGINPPADDSSYNTGAVYVFTRNGSSWNSPDYIKAPDSARFDQFGYAVALGGDGNTLAVGAPGKNLNTGAVYLFNRGTAWSYQKRLTVPITATNTTNTGDMFGYSVALSGDASTLAVGAPAEDSSTIGINSTPDESVADSGAVYLYINNNGNWTSDAYVKATNTGSGDEFGNAVALSYNGNRLAVGAHWEDSSDTTSTTLCTLGVTCLGNDNASGAGAVYIFHRGGLWGTWITLAYVKPTNTGAGDDFGFRVALSSDGNTLAVGAWQEYGSSTGINGADDDLAYRAGAAYVFASSNGKWLQQAYVKASNADAGDYFGAVALSGDGNTLAVGSGDGSNGTGICATGDTACAASQSNNDLKSSGAVYLY